MILFALAHSMSTLTVPYRSEAPSSSTLITGPGQLPPSSPFLQPRARAEIDVEKSTSSLDLTAEENPAGTEDDQPKGQTSDSLGLQLDQTRPGAADHPSGCNQPTPHNPDQTAGRAVPQLQSPTASAAAKSEADDVSPSKGKLSLKRFFRSAYRHSHYVDLVLIMSCG